jgi:hypothetical protein
MLDANRYVELYIQDRLVTSRQMQLKEIRDGFRSGKIIYRNDSISMMIWYL